MWAAYEISDPFAGLPRNLTPKDLSRQELQGWFERFLSERDARIRAVSRLMASAGYEGVAWATDPRDRLLERARWVGQWLEALLVAERPDPYSGDDRIGPHWRSAARDVGVLLGEDLIAVSESLRWDLATGPKTLANLNRPVVTGFKAPNRRFHVDYWWSAETSVYRALARIEPTEIDHPLVYKSRNALKFVP